MTRLVIEPIPEDPIQMKATLERVLQDIADALNDIQAQLDSLDARVTALEP